MAKRRTRSLRLRNMRFAAKLLYQFKRLSQSGVNARRLCEEQIVLVHAVDAESAFLEARRLGRSAEAKWKAQKARVHFEFLGVLELMEIDWLDEHEVWWEFSVRLRPKERRLVPKKTQLMAFRELTRRPRRNFRGLM